MHSTLRHGLSAALLLLVLAPAARALVITQTLSTAYSGSYIGSPVGPGGGLGHVWETNRFDPQLGTLLSVSITASITESITVREVNAIMPNGLLGFTPRVTLASTMGFSIGMASSGTASAAGPMQLLPYLQEGSGTFVLTNSLNAVVTDAAALADWQRPTPWIGPLNIPHSGIPVDFRSIYWGEESFGSVTATGTLNATVVYNYAVPEHAHALALLASALACCGLVHRRRSIAASTRAGL